MTHRFGVVSNFSILVAVCPSDVHKELLSCVHPGAALGVPRTTEKLKQSPAIYCLLLIILQLCPWFYSTPLLSRKTKNKTSVLTLVTARAQRESHRVTGKGMVFPGCILANQRFVFSSLWKTLRTHMHIQRKKKKQKHKKNPNLLPPKKKKRKKEQRKHFHFHLCFT